MKNNKNIKRLATIASLAALFLPATEASALGIVSRSCLAAGAQESITVDWSFNKFWLWTASEHYRNGMFVHTVNTTRGGTTNGWENTWRSYAGHLGSEYWYGKVVGYHWRSNGGLIVFLGNSTAVDCNLANWGR